MINNVQIDNERVGRAIAAHRQRLSLTQQALAVLMNVTHQAVSKWENGAALPDMQTMLSLARLFGVPMEALLAGETQARSDAQAPQEAAEGTPAQAASEQPGQTEPEPAQTEDGEERALTLGELTGMAPFLDGDTLAALARAAVKAHGFDAKALVGLAPFLEEDALGALALENAGMISSKQLIPLAPFLPQDAMVSIARRLAPAGETAPGTGGGLGEGIRAVVRSGLDTARAMLGNLRDENGADVHSHAARKPERADKAAARGDILRRIARKAVADRNTQWLEEHIEDLDNDTVDEIARLCVETGYYDVLAELCEHMDGEALRRTLAAGAAAGRWDVVEQMAEHLDDDLRQELLDAAVEQSNWQMINALSEGL